MILIVMWWSSGGQVVVKWWWWCQTVVVFCYLLRDTKRGGEEETFPKYSSGAKKKTFKLPHLYPHHKPASREFQYSNHHHPAYLVHDLAPSVTRKHDEHGQYCVWEVSEVDAVLPRQVEAIQLQTPHRKHEKHQERQRHYLLFVIAAAAAASITIVRIRL
jgi:hypothetical protein